MPPAVVELANFQHVPEGTTDPKRPT